jgi:signal peptidase I
MKMLREAGIIILVAVVVFVLLHLTVQSYTVVMSSMDPNIHDGDCIMVSKVTYRSSDPQRGQVIVFRPPFDSPYPFIKRVIGLPGETVEIKDGQVFINDTALDEHEYISENARPNYTMPATEVGENEYFVLGDNRNNSNDSHTGWTVPRGNIIGKAWFTYWPPSRLGTVRHYGYPDLTGVGEQDMIVSHSFGVRLG